MLGWPGSSPRRTRHSGSITICPLLTASSILPIFTSDLDRCAVPGLLDVGDGHHAKSAGLIPEGPLRSTGSAAGSVSAHFNRSILVGPELPPLRNKSAGSVISLNRFVGRHR